MPITIRTGRPDEPGAKELLQASHDLMNTLFDPGECHYLDFEALNSADIVFLVAEYEGRIVGTGAFARKEGYGEVKSMYVNPNARGRGAADAILAEIERIARQESLPLLRLETGVGLNAALRLYERNGFMQIAPFGDYTGDGASLFYEKQLN